MWFRFSTDIADLEGLEFACSLIDSTLNQSLGWGASSCAICSIVGFGISSLAGVHGLPQCRSIAPGASTVFAPDPLSAVGGDNVVFSDGGSSVLSCLHPPQ
jgi:hypothetical protein